MVDLRLSLDNIEDYAWMNIDESEDEEVIWKAHPSLIPHIPQFIVGVFAILAAIGGSIYFLDRIIEQPRLIAIPILVLLSSVVGMALVYVRVKSTFYVLTTEKIVKKTGVPYIRTHTLKTQLDKVQNPHLKQGFMEKIFGLGDIHIATAGTSEIEMHLLSVPGPQRPETEIDERS